MADLAISKVSYKDNLLTEVEAYRCQQNLLGEKVILSRNELVVELLCGRKVVTITKTSIENWDIVNTLSYTSFNSLSVLNSSNPNLFFVRPIGDSGYGDWLGLLPKFLPRRKTFISYFHQDDQHYKDRFEHLFGDLVINKSVGNGDIDSDNSTEYIKSLIQNQYLHDTTVAIVLISEQTKHRKHIDWEISAALNYKVGNSYAGLVGIHLPHHQEYGNQSYMPSLQPQRLAINAGTGYAKIYDWREDRVLMQNIIEDAFLGRTQRIDSRDNKLVQMQRNTS